MTQQHDFKKIYKLFKDGDVVVHYLSSGVSTNEIEQTIKSALRIADRLQSGEVSEAMIDAAYSSLKNNDDPTILIFEAMSAQLLKEVCDE